MNDIQYIEDLIKGHKKIIATYERFIKEDKQYPDKIQKYYEEITFHEKKIEELKLLLETLQKEVKGG